MADYSQNGEQNAILLACPRRGRFLDVGAYDAEHCSNTRALWELGWGGVLVEPVPQHAERIRRTYDDDPDVVVMQAAVGMEAGMAEMRVTRMMMSTLHAETYEKWRERVPYHKRPVRVSVVTLPEVWALHGPFEFVNLDAEGLSVDLLGILMTIAAPACVCVEHDDRLDEVAEIAAACGYEILDANAENTVLAVQL